MNAVSSSGFTIHCCYSYLPCITCIQFLEHCSCLEFGCWFPTVFLNISSTLSFRPSLYAVLQREFPFMLLCLCQQYSAITCDLTIPGLWWGAGVSSVLLIKCHSYKGTVSLGLRPVVISGLLPLSEGAVLSPFQILAPLLKENLLCFLSALPPGVEEDFPTALSQLVCCLLPAVWLLLWRGGRHGESGWSFMPFLQQLLIAFLRLALQGDASSGRSSIFFVVTA